MRRYGGAIAGLGLLVILAIVLLVRNVDIDVPFVGGSLADDTLRQDQVGPYQGPAVPDVQGAISVAGAQPASEMALSVLVEAPDGAQKMQLADNPGFLGADWQPVAAETRVPVSNAGQQTVFVRFTLADGSTSRISVAGGEVDQTYRSATASADGDHEASWIGPFSATELAIRVEAGRLERGGLEAYDLNNPPPEDNIETRKGLKVVERNGQPYGMQVSARSDVIRRPDRLIGRPMDIGAVAGGAWSISSADDPAYAEGVPPVQVRYVARPTGGGTDGNLDRIFPVVYDLALSLPSPLQPGSNYQITPPDEVSPMSFDYDPATNRSPAVRVNQVGFAPNDGLKVAYLSGWFDGIGLTATAGPPGPTFQVVDVDSGATMFNGTGKLRAADNELDRGDLTGSPVIELDFSTVERDGSYRVCVDGVGCSYDFEINDGVWHELTASVTRSLYHQRSGIELSPPYTPVRRPRPYHPADGVIVRASEYSLLQAQTETANTDFSRLAAEGTEEVVEEAWGGHFDAGDWDRRINHLWYSRVAAELVMQFPDVYQDRDMNIPESGDGVPDLLDEALWSLDLYRRMQTADGAIRGGIEASGHPPVNAASWVDDLAVFAYKPDPYSSYIYAGVAAEFSVALRPYDPARADELLASALRAMDWAEGQTVSGASGAVEATVAEQRPVAAAALLLATGESRWHDRFVQTASFLADQDPYLSCQAHTRCDAAWIYLNVDESLTDPATREDLRNRFTASADAIVAAADTVAYGWTVENPFVPLVWGLGSGGAPHTSGLLKAYLLSGDDRYRNAALRSAGAALGANPMNRALLTGVGDEPVRHPQINDVKAGGLSAWPGTPVYGHHLLNSAGDDQWVADDILGPAGASPPPTDMPYLWQWYDVDSVALFNEFTVHQSHAEALLTFATLAATS